jgi:hypothetical protein
MADLAELAHSLNFEVDDLFPVIDGLHILQFAQLKDGELTLIAEASNGCNSTVTSARLCLRNICSVSSGWPPTLWTF